MKPMPETVCDGVYLLGSQSEAEALIDLFEAIARQEGWQPGEHLRTHSEQSAYFAAYVGGEVAGGMQVVVPDTQGRLPFQAVWPEVVLDAPCRTAHVPILAIRPQFRGPLRLFWPLCVELWRFCAVHNLDTIVIEATPSMLARYRRIGWTLDVVGELRMHWGEACYLCRADVQAVAGAILLRAVRSSAFRTLVLQAMRPLGDTDCVLGLALP